MTDSNAKPADIVAAKQADFVMTCPRLSPIQVVLGAVFCAAVLWGIPQFWDGIEPFEAGVNFRIPYASSNDYHLYRRLAEHATKEDAVMLIGDSVIWGEYTLPTDTLVQELAAKFPEQKFVNGGVNGLHPLAMEGMVRRYGKAIRGQRVIVHCNLLWMSSPERDLSSAEASAFNHERLVRQFSNRWPWVTSSIPAYHADFSERLGIAIDASLPFRSTLDHVRETAFRGQDVHRWTLQEPYQNPLSQIRPVSPRPEQTLRHRERAWNESGIRQTEFDWVSLESSRQWQALLTLIELLKDRDNQVCVVVGPFNTHLLKPANRDAHNGLRSQLSEALSGSGTLVFAKDALPSEQYGDASHPLANGYGEFATKLAADPRFRAWLQNETSNGRGTSPTQ